ncbi:MAG TPA: hypothetical protein VFX60_02225 [Micromonospora sp.]|nr:hypothetical protein [Micromonospora sp.]
MATSIKHEARFKSIQSQRQLRRTFIEQEGVEPLGLPARRLDQ